MTTRRSMVQRRLCLVIVIILLLGSFTACQEQEIPDTGQISGSGTLEGRSVAVVSELGGQVAEITVAEGDSVVEGAVVVRLDGAEAQVQVAQAEAAVAAAEANLARLQAGPRPEVVAAAESAVRAAQYRSEDAESAIRYAQEAITRPIELNLEIADAQMRRDLAEQGVEQAEAELAAEELNYHIYVDLKDDVSKETRQVWDLRVAAAKARIEQAQAELEAAQAELNALMGMRAQPREGIAELHAAQSTYTATLRAIDQAEAELADLLSGTRPEEIEIAEAQLARAEAGLDMTLIQQSMLTLMAPISGVVTSRHYQAGEIAPAGRPLVTLTQLDELYLTLYVPETRIGEVRLGQSVTVTVDAFSNETFTGTVRQIASQAEYTPRSVETVADRARRVFAVEVHLPNPEHRLQPGVPAEAVIVTDTP